MSGTSFLGVFRPESLEQFQYTQSDALALYWFLRAVLSDWMLQIPGPAYWVKHTYVAECLHTSPRKVRENFDRLCNGPLQKHLIPSSGGRRCYYSITPAFLEFLVPGCLSEEEMDKVNKAAGLKLIESPLPATTGRDGVRQEILEILQELSSLKQRGVGTPPLFANRLPKAGGKFTKTLLSAAKRIQALYDGTFVRQFPVVSEEFLSRNHITKDVWTTIRSWEGSWEAVRVGILNASRNYRRWFWEENEPEDKGWLPRDISQWLYDGFNQTSLFVACLSGKPFPLRETQADRIYNTLPSRVSSVAQEFYRKDWDSAKFWWKIRQVVEWYTEHESKVDTIPGMRYWFEGGLSSWFRRYLNWLGQFEGLLLKQIGTGNATWAAWCAQGAREHGFSVTDLEKV